MPVSFENIKCGVPYSQNELALLWGYTSYHATARGIVTPRDDHKIIIFVTEEKQSSARQYRDRLVDNILSTEGPDDHFAEDRIERASMSRDEIHIFYRKRHHSDFTYLGKAKLIKLDRKATTPSYFEYELLS